MPSPEQLAAWPSHLLAPSLPDLVAKPATAALSATATAGARDPDLKLIMLEAAMPAVAGG